MPSRNEEMFTNGHMFWQKKKRNVFLVKNTIWTVQQVDSVQLIIWLMIGLKPNLVLSFYLFRQKQ